MGSQWCIVWDADVRDAGTLWVYLLAVELFSPVRVLVWTVGNLRTQVPDEWSQQKMVWAFLGIQLSRVQVMALWMCLSRWEATDGKKIASSFNYQKSSHEFSGVQAHSSPPWPPYFLSFFLTQPIRWHLENRDEVRLTYPGQEMMAGKWVQPSSTTIFNFLPNLFAPLHIPETTLLSLQQRLLAVLWDTQVHSTGEFAWSFLAPASYLSSYPCRMMQHKWWNCLLKLLCGQILLLFFLQRCHKLHLNWMMKTLFLSAVCFAHLFSECNLGTYQSFSFSSAPTSSITINKKPPEAQWKPRE